MSSNGQALAERYLKFGIFLAPFHPMEESPLLCMERGYAVAAAPRHAGL